MSVGTIEPQELYVFQRTSDSNLQEQCPDQCGDDVDDDNRCIDPITLRKLKLSNLIASRQTKFVGSDGIAKQNTTCYDEAALRKWDITKLGTSDNGAGQFTDPVVRTLGLVWPKSVGQTPERVARERVIETRRLNRLARHGEPVSVNEYGIPLDEYGRPLTRGAIQAAITRREQAQEQREIEARAIQAANMRRAEAQRQRDYDMANAQRRRDEEREEIIRRAYFLQRLEEKRREREEQERLKRQEDERHANARKNAHLFYKNMQRQAAKDALRYEEEKKRIRLHYMQMQEHETFEQSVKRGEQIKRDWLERCEKRAIRQWDEARERKAPEEAEGRQESESESGSSEYESC